MAGMNEDLISFYLAGRAVKSLGRLKKSIADPDEIAEKIIAGTAVRAAISDACAEAAKPTLTDRKRKTAWLTENKDDLPTAPSSSSNDDAWAAYCQGMADELAYAIEPDVLDALEGDGEDDEDGDDDEEDDDEHEDGDDKDQKPA